MTSTPNSCIPLHLNKSPTQIVRQTDNLRAVVYAYSAFYGYICELNTFFSF